MVGTDGVAYVGFLLELLGDLHAQDGVRQLFLILSDLAEVVEQTGTLGGLGVQAQLGSHGGAQLGNLDGVLQEVLSVGGTVFHAADHLDQIGGHVVDAEVDDGALTGLDDLLFHLFLHLVNHLFDTCGVDAAVGDQLLERQAGDLTADRVEA